jgi:hypothetical protein
LGERRLCKAEVRGSNPLGSTPSVDRRTRQHRTCTRERGAAIVTIRGLRTAAGRLRAHRTTVEERPITRTLESLVA